MTANSHRGELESLCDGSTSIERESAEAIDALAPPSPRYVGRLASGRSWSVLSTLGQSLVVLDRQPQSTATAVAEVLDVGITAVDDALRTLSEMRLVIALHIGTEVRYAVNGELARKAELLPNCTVAQMLDLFSQR